MNEKILLVDDDPNILDGFKRQLRKLYPITTAPGGEEGLKAMSEDGPFAVVVSDLRMPGMDGVQFLSRVRESAPDSVRMMLTGNADLDAAIEAVNEGNIFRFLTKPCPPQAFARALEAGIGQYRLVKAERELLEKTLSGSVKVLTDIISLLSPIAFGRASRVRRIMGKLAEKTRVEDPWTFELAGMLSQTGCVTMPTETVDNIYRGRDVTAVDMQMFQRHPQVGHDLIANIPRLENIAEIIAYQSKRYNGEGTPLDDRKGEDIPLGARALHVALDFDMLVSTGKEPRQALHEIQQRQGWYDPKLVEALASIVRTEASYTVRSVGIGDLVSGMVLADNVYASSGMLVISRGLEVTPSLRERLANFDAKIGIRGPIKVLVPTMES